MVVEDCCDRDHNGDNPVATFSNQLRKEASLLVDVLIPTYERQTALAITLTSLVAQTMRDFDIIVSDQSSAPEPLATDEVRAVARVLETHGHQLRAMKHLPRRGVAEHRQFLLDLANAPYVLFLDDDLILEPDVIERMLRAIQRERCGFVGSAVIGLSHVEDVRPDEQEIEFWGGRVTPEVVSPENAAWERHRLHNAANLYHLQLRLAVPPEECRVYRVAWTGGAVLFDRRQLVEAGGFEFWHSLPAEHAGEDVLAQMRVMARYGGCGLFPSGVYHQELPTTITHREVDAPRAFHIAP
jgi:glycosyltransferase involved in cell wall biosynthesis